MIPRLNNPTCKISSKGVAQFVITAERGGLIRTDHHRSLVPISRAQQSKGNPAKQQGNREYEWQPLQGQLSREQNSQNFYQQSKALFADSD
jgi:hypothetical protein